MPFDLTSLLDPSHLASFLGGTAVGAAGKYIADRFTDQRHKQETEAAERKRFAKVRDAMPELIREMNRDLKKNSDLVLRELVVLPNSGVTFTHDRPRLQYFETAHPHALNQVSLLVGAGYAEKVTEGHVAIFRLTEEFVSRLQDDA